MSTILKMYLFHPDDEDSRQTESGHRPHPGQFCNIGLGQSERELTVGHSDCPLTHVTHDSWVTAKFGS